MKHLIYIISILLLTTSCRWGGDTTTADSRNLKRTYRMALDTLNYCLEHRDDYVEHKQSYIDSLTDMLRDNALSTTARYDVIEKVAVAYISYQSDSAVVYLTKCIELARKNHDADMTVRSKSYLALLYAYNGRHYESNELLESISDTTQLDSATMLTYYIAKHRLCRELYSFLERDADRADMRRREMYCCRRILSLTDDPMTRYAYRYFDANCRHDWTEASAICDSMLALSHPHSHLYAKAANHKAIVCAEMGLYDMQHIWQVRAAIADALCGVKDYGALEDVATALFENGNIPMAMRLMRIVIKDTKFFGSSVRAMRNISSLPQIESAYYQHTRRIRVLWILLSSVMVAFVLFGGGALWYIARQKRRLQTLYETLRVSNDNLQRSTASLSETNSRLRQLNARIADANNIKEAYIGSFMMIFSEYINRISDMQRRVSKLVREENMADLRREYGSVAVKYDELKEFYRLFDSVFLHLYPTFIDDFNALVVEDARTVQRKPDTLTTELRIFALVRLGFSDNAQIASLLHCSINTVYNYRSRLRLKAVDMTTDLEVQVVQIGIPDTEKL